MPYEAPLELSFENSPERPSGYLSVLTPRVFWSPPDSLRDRPIMGAFAGQHSSLIVETGASPAHANQFRSALSGLGAPRPRFAAVTHWHWDHVFGTSTLDIPTIGHAETRRRVLEMARLDWRDHALDGRVAAGTEQAFIASHVKVEMTNAERAVLVITAPELAYTGRVEVDLGALTVEIIHVGGDHARDSSVIFSPEERVAFLGDCFYSGFSRSGNYYTMARLFPLMERLEALPADYYVLSHHPAPVHRDQFLHEIEERRRIGALVERLGPDRERLLANLEDALGEPVNEDHLEDLDCFLLGLTIDL